MQINVGDWVTHYRAGFFRVEKIFNFRKHQSMAVLKKGFTNKLRPSVSWDTCSISLCKKVSSETLLEIESILNEDNRFFKKFNEYVTPPIQSLYNTTVKFKTNDSEDTMLRLLNLEREGKTIQEVEELLKENGVQWLGSLQSNESINLQLTCTDYETNLNGDFIYKSARFYKF